MRSIDFDDQIRLHSSHFPGVHGKEAESTIFTDPTKPSARFSYTKSILPYYYTYLKMSNAIHVVHSSLHLIWESLGGGHYSCIRDICSWMVPYLYPFSCSVVNDSLTLTANLSGSIFTELLFTNQGRWEGSYSCTLNNKSPIFTHP